MFCFLPVNPIQPAFWNQRALPHSNQCHSFSVSSPLPCTTRRHRLYVTASANNRPSKNEDEKDNKSALTALTSNVSRRQVIQLLNGVLGLATLTLIFKMKEQFRLMSPRTVLSALGISFLPSRTAAAQEMTEQSPQKIREASEYLRRLESRPAIKCPDFAKGSDWINSGPLSLQGQLSGKIVLLDFFTYCCINCQHVLPKLRALEEKYGSDGSGGVVVVGVHSAKFSAERETANIAAAVDRYGVKHPVINDEDMSLWNSLGISSWPTLALVGPKGNVLAIWSGERQEEDIDNILAAATDFYADILDHKPLPVVPASATASVIGRNQKQLLASVLRYPGKITVSSDGASLFVADSGNHRIIQVDAATANVTRTFGSGQSGLKDSSRGTDAEFHTPQGIALYSNDRVLFVADTETHTVRAIDMNTGAVVTIGGNGEQGFDYMGGRAGTDQPLSSPWDVEVADDYLYVAIAGTHQLWRLPLSSLTKSEGTVNIMALAKIPWEVFSGSGRELEKNSSVGRTAGWAQPSHLSISPTQNALFVADSESSSIRTIDVTSSKHPTRTIAGGDGLIPENLFAFGDKEGRGSQAKFQHPLAVCADLSTNGNRVFVADSYNHRIKVVDTDSGVASNFCGSGKPGFKDGTEQNAMFWEPAGLAMSPDGSKLYVADTNNSAIRVIDIASRKVSTLQISDSSNSSAAQKNTKSKRLIPNRRRAVRITYDEVVKSNAVLSFTINLPMRAHFTPGTTSRFQVNALQLQGATEDDGNAEILGSGKITQTKELGSFKFDLGNVDVVKGLRAVEVETVTYYCTEADDVCRVESDVFIVTVSTDGSNTPSISHTIVPRKLPVAPLAGLNA